MALKLIKQNPARSGEKWVNFDEDTKILLAGIDNAEYQVALERMRRRLQRNDARFEEGQVGIVTGELTEIQNQCMLLSHFVVKGWEGVEDAEGNPLKFSPQVAAELMQSNGEFFVFVLRESSLIAEEARQELAETVGKPLPVLSGKGSGLASPKKGGRSTSA